MDWTQALEEADSKARNHRDIPEVRLDKSVLATPTDNPEEDQLRFSARGEEYNLTMTNWAYSQLCTKLKVPCRYVRRCPADLRQANLRYWMDLHSKGILLRTLTAEGKVRAVLSDRYGILDDHDLLRTLHGELAATVNLDYATLGSETSRFTLNDCESLEVRGPSGEEFKIGCIARNSEVGQLALKVNICLSRLHTARRIPYLFQAIQSSMSISKRHIGIDKAAFLGKVRDLIGTFPDFRVNAEQCLRRALEGSPTQSDLEKIRKKAEDIFGVAWATEKWPEIAQNPSLTWYSLADLFAAQAAEEGLSEMVKIRGEKLAGLLLNI